MPNFSSLRWIGFYIIVISFLVLLHVKYITLNSQEGVKIITDTFDNLLKAFDASSNKGLVDSFSYYISNSGGRYDRSFIYLFIL